MTKVKSATPAQKENPTKTASSKDTTKKAKSGKSKVVKANLAKAAQEVEEEEQAEGRKSKYIYPDNSTAKEKKTFRRLARAKLSQFTKQLKKLKKDTSAEGVKALHKAEKEFKAFQEDTYAPAD